MALLGLMFDNIFFLQVLEAGSHTVNGKTIEPKRATKQKRYEPQKPKKVFVGGVPNELSEDDMRAHFGQYGEV